jgi:hypothetical protein
MRLITRDISSINPKAYPNIDSLCFCSLGDIQASIFQSKLRIQKPHSLLFIGIILCILKRSMVSPVVSPFGLKSSVILIGKLSTSSFPVHRGKVRTTKSLLNMTKK